MATLRNKRKLATVSRDTPENTRKTQSQNTLDPGMAQEYISQVSEEIEGRVVTKKLSKDISRTDSCFLGALSKLGEFLLNTQVRTSGNIQEQQLRKPRTHWGSIPRRSLSRSGVLYLPL